MPYSCWSISYLVQLFQCTDLINWFISEETEARDGIGSPRLRGCKQQDWGLFCPVFFLLSHTRSLQTALLPLQCVFDLKPNSNSLLWVMLSCEHQATPNCADNSLKNQVSRCSPYLSKSFFQAWKIKSICVLIKDLGEDSETAQQVNAAATNPGDLSLAPGVTWWG